MMQKNVKTRTQGRDMAELLIDNYLNAHPRDKKLIDWLLQYPSLFRNAMVLILLWIEKMSRKDYWDGRNIDSIQFARKVAVALELYEDYDFFSRVVSVKPKLDDESGSELYVQWAKFLGEGNPCEFREFVNAGSQSHPTLQQNFMRHCIFFCEMLSQNNVDDDHRFVVKTARKILCLHEALPFI